MNDEFLSSRSLSATPEYFVISRCLSKRAVVCVTRRVRPVQDHDHARRLTVLLVHFCPHHCCNLSILNLCIALLPYFSSNTPRNGFICCISPFHFSSAVFFQAVLPSTNFVSALFGDRLYYFGVRILVLPSIFWVFVPLVGFVSRVVRLQLSFFSSWNCPHVIVVKTS